MPRWCDMRYEFADFPLKEGMAGSGSCRTFQAIYCKKIKKIVPKSAPCREPEQESTGQDQKLKDK